MALRDFYVKPQCIVISGRHKYLTLAGDTVSYLKSLVADSFAFLVPHYLGLWVPSGLTHKGSHSPLDSCLVLWGSCESRRCCEKRENHK